MSQKPLEYEKGGFARLDGQNYKAIKRALRSDEGRILIGRPGYRSFREMVFDATILLYDHPRIEKDSRGFALSTNRGSKIVEGQSWQTGWENDREYILRQLTPAPDAATAIGRSMFESLPCGENWEFRISFPDAVYFGLDLENSAILYIPRTSDIEPALRFALCYMVERINTSAKENAIAPARVEEMIVYAVNDLRTGEVFGRNVQAGLDADALLG